jgi:hypothetical protein
MTHLKTEVWWHMEERDESPDVTSKWIAIFGLGSSEQVEKVPDTHGVRFREYGIVGLTKQETGVLEHHVIDPINLRNALTSDIDSL